MTCRVIQRFETKLYSFLQFDKLVNLSNYKTKIDFFVKSFVAYLQRKLNKYAPETIMVLYTGEPNDDFFLNPLRLKTF